MLSKVLDNIAKIMIKFLNSQVFEKYPPLLIQRILLNISLSCAILVMVLWCFNYFPYRPFFEDKSWQLQYPISILGIASFVLSCAWFQTLMKNKILVIPIYLLSVWGYGMAVWFCMIFYLIPREKAKQIFIYSISFGFLLNAIHMILEAFANLGASNIKEFLMSINHYFRVEKLDGGWWPPSYYEGRIRGLYAEPGYLAGGILPVFGFCWYFYQKNSQKAWLIIPIILFAVFLWCYTLSGILSASLFFGLILLYEITKLIGLKKTIILTSFTGTLGIIAFILFILHSPLGHKIQNTFVAASDLANHVILKNQDSTIDQFDYKNLPPTVPKIFTRATLFITHMQMGLDNPFGIGSHGRKKMWKALEDENMDGAGELKIYVDLGITPALSEYTHLASQQGIVGLVIFLIIISYVFYQSITYYRTSKDIFALALIFTLGAYMMVLLSQKIYNTYAFAYFTSFLFAYTAPRLSTSSQDNSSII